MQATAYYTIPSHNAPGTYYTVTTFADGDTRCTCPDATYRRRQGKHGRQHVAGMVPTVPAGTRAAALAEQYAAETDATEVSRIIRGW